MSRPRLSAQPSNENKARHLTAAEVGRLLEAAKGDRMEPLSSCSCSARVYGAAKALALHWCDVDLSDEGEVWVGWTPARVDRQWMFDEPKTESSHRFVQLRPHHRDASPAQGRGGR
jgi:integrase